jgi:Domain of unknown function (DUF1818)
VLEREGEGWRLAWDGQRDPFPVLIGGASWASELTAAEGQALAHALGVLQSQHRALMDTLMEEESISLDYQGSTSEGGALWMALEGDRQTWSLHFVLQPAPGLRGLEGGWGCGAAVAFAQACQDLLTPTGGSLPTH